MSYGFSVARLRKKRLANDPFALKEAEDARVAHEVMRRRRKEEQRRASMVRLVKRELKRVLCKELLGAKASQISCPQLRHDKEFGDRANFEACLTYAGTLFHLQGDINRRQAYIGRGFKERSVVFQCKIVLDGAEIAQVLYDRRGKRFDGWPNRESKLLYITPNLGAGVTRSAFLDEIAKEITNSRRARTNEKTDKRGAQEEEGAAVAPANDSRSRNSLLTS